MKPGIFVYTLFIANLFAASGASCQSGNMPSSPRTNHSNHMPQNEARNLQQEAEQLLRLSDEQYFSLDQPGILRLQDSLGEMGEQGPGSIGKAAPHAFAIGMPAAMDKGAQKELPVLLATVQSGQRNWEVELSQNLWFILREASTGKVMLSRPFLWDKRAAIPAPSKSGPAPDAANANATTMRVSKINLIKELFPNSAWQPGWYFLTAIDYDWVSNSGKVELTNLDRKYPQAVPDLKERLQHFEQMKEAGQAQPAEAGGLQMSLDGPACHIAFRLRQAEGLFLTQDDKEYFLCTILLFKRDANSPQKINLALPVARKSDAGTEYLEASCDLNLGKAGMDMPLAGDYMVYLVSGPLFYGPVALHLP